MNASTPILLRIDASARHNASVSRDLATTVEHAWLAAHPGGRVVRRDLAQQPVPHIDGATIQGFFTAPDAFTPALREATATSDQLIQELKQAHTVLIAAPIYNFSVPSALKAWIDQVVRIGHTFGHDGQRFNGLVQGPRAVLALVYGLAGYQSPQNPLSTQDHLRPLLTTVLQFIGIEQVDVVLAEGTSGDPVQAQASLQAARDEARALFQAA